MSTVFDEIRTGAAAVASVATHVRIDEDGLDAFAARLSLDGPDDDPGHARLADDESTAAYVVTLDAVNFGSGYFPWLHKRPGHSGYHTVAAALREHVERLGPPTPDWLRSATAARCADLFDQSLDERWPAELMSLFATAFRDLGELVDRVGGGRFLGLVDAARGRAGRLVEILDEMPYYHDVHRHPQVDRLVPLYKRAQITAFDLATAFDGAGPGRFDDLDQLTMFADNLVPHVLRLEGVLTFSEELIARIDAAEDIATGSEPEVEIRAGAVHAVELLADRLASRGCSITAGGLDGVLWRMGARPEYKAVSRHRTRCVYY